MSKILQTNDIRKEFDGLVAVDDISVSFTEDELCSIIGPNGAGKTTFFNLLTGTLPPTSGTVTFQGTDITDLSASDIASEGLIRSYQITQLFKDITALENVYIAAQTNYNPYNFWSDVDDFPEIEDEAMTALAQVGLEDKHDSIASNLSHGEQRTLELAIALGSDPEMLLLDEPTAGMSAEETQAMITLIGDLAEELPVVLVEHKMSVVMSVSDRIIVLHNGQKIADGSPDEVRAESEVQRVYLGGR